MPYRKFHSTAAVAGLVVILVFAAVASAAPKPQKKRPAPKPKAPPVPLRWVFTPRKLADEVVTLYPRYGMPLPPSLGAGADAVLYVSPRDHRVLCLDAATGKLRWEFTTGGPVREAPSVWKGKVYFGSDDGWVYCLDVKTGKVVWKHPPPHGRHSICYGKIISTFPVRTNVLVHTDPSANGGKAVAYFGSGAFPHDGTFVTALDAATGKRVWQNAASGEYPHDWGALAPVGLLSIQKNPKAEKADRLLVANEGMGGKPFRLSDGFEFHRQARKHRQSVHIIHAAIGDATFGAGGGGVICRAPGAGDTPAKTSETVKADALGDTSAAAKAADAIIKHTGITEGYALVLDGRTGALALELARKTKLLVYIVFKDETKLAAARAALQQTGLYGPRINALLDSPALPIEWPPYFADVIVSEAAGAGELPEATRLEKLLKPIRGVAMLGSADGKHAADALQTLAKGTGLDGWKPLATGGRWIVCRRGKLPGAGAWTHQNADIGNTMCSDDAVLQPPLGVVWYGAPIADDMVNRTGMAPLIFNGVLISPGANVLEGYDQYTGRRLWRHDMRNVSRKNPYGGSGNFAANSKNLFVAYGHQCFRINPWTGETVQKYSGGWGFMAVDEERIYASQGNEVAGKGLRAVDIKTGKVIWTLSTGALQFFNNAIAIGGGGIYFVMNGFNPDFKKQGLDEMAAYAKANLPAAEAAQIVKEAQQRDVRILVGVDAKTGKTRYERGIDVSNCGGVPGTFAMIKWRKYPIGLIYKDGHLVHYNISAGGKYWGNWAGGNWAWRGVAVRKADDGSLVWYKTVNFRGRVLVVDDTLHADPYALELKTGKWIQRTHPIRGESEKWTWCRFNKHCGIYVASKYFLFGRSGGVAYHDLKRDRGLYTFLHSRPSCWFDTVSGGGLMIKPPQSYGCSCEVNAPFTFAFGTVSTEPATPQIYSTSGPSLPVKHLYVNVGGMGDYSDKDGHLWVADQTHRPTPKIPMLQFRPGRKFYGGGRDVMRSAIFTRIENTDVPFVFATMARGLKTLTIRLDKAGAAKAARYDVAVGFVAPPGDAPGQRVFDVAVAGKTVLKGFDVVKEAGKPDRAVWKEFKGLEAAETMTIELTAGSETPTIGQMPILSAVKILRVK